MLPRKRPDWVGDSLTALCGGALALNLVLIVGLLALLAVNGIAAFSQHEVVELTLDDGSKVMGEIRDRVPVADAATSSAGAPLQRVQVEVGNRDIGGPDFRWIDESRIVSRRTPADAVVIERLEWGPFYGRMVELRRGDQVVAAGSDDVWRAFPAIHDEKLAHAKSVRRLERDEIGTVNYEIEALRRDEKRLALEGVDLAGQDPRVVDLRRRQAERLAEYDVLSKRLFAMREEMQGDILVAEAADGTRKDMPVASIVRAIRPNQLGTVATAKLYSARVWEFLSGDPRESNTEGGIFPAIFGTVMMVFLMSFAVAPFGVLAALYLREYAKQGPLVRIVRIAVNNLAGVPSIVFGVFGLGFFVYVLGGSIDRLFFPEVLPTPTFGTGGILWSSLTLALLTVPVVIVATEEGLAAVPRIVREGSLALGATKFETTWKVVVPAAAPGILTGMILAMARAAGEVAPLMIVGMVKLAPALPIDGHFPFVHMERKFMHLGFHIYDVGFQSPNVEATKPLVFATAFLLIIVVTAMNLTAIAVRNHLRRKYASSAV